MLSMCLPQQIQGDVPQRHHIFGGMVRPDTAAVFIERDVQRPMELILDVPMLANHRDEGGGRAADAGNIDTIITGDWCTSIGRTNSFHDNHRLQIRPLRELRDGCKVWYGPYSSSYGAAMGIIEGIKEILGGAPGELMFDVLMEVPFDSRIGFFVIALQGQEIVPTLRPDLASDGGLTAHRINGNNTAFDG